MKWQLPYPEVLCSKYDGGGTQYARFRADSLVGAIKWQQVQNGMITWQRVRPAHFALRV